VGLEETVSKRITFLKEQIDPSNKSIVNDTFQLQIDVLSRVDRGHIADLILRKRQELEDCQTINESDRVFTELEALEWLQRQVARNLGSV
jgi:hypothetical protein